MHAIRLNEPWESEAIVVFSRTPEGGLSAAEGGSERAGRERIRFGRRFGRPTGLLPGQPVDLVIDRPAARGQAWLNGALLGELTVGTTVFRFSVHHRLQPRNQLVLEFDVPIEIGADRSVRGFIHEVRLEIRPG